jgi:hypothetical protein
MLRVFKPTSPMNLGTWVLSVSGAADTAVVACEVLGVMPRLQLAASATSAALGPALCTYTAVLLSDTSVPVWYAARRELPFAFAGSALASAGAAATLVARGRDAGPARRAVTVGAAIEIAAMSRMERRLGMVGEVYHEGRAGMYARIAKGLTGAGAAIATLAGRRRGPAMAAAAMVLGGSAAERFAVFHAGKQSAQDPRYTVEPQRSRREELGGAGAADAPQRR